MNAARTLLLAALLGAVATSPAGACGLDAGLGDEVSAAHPRSIDVALAIHDAVEVRRLAPRAAAAAEAREARTDDTVHRAHEVLGNTSAAPLPAIALLLVESRHWSRHLPDAAGDPAHADGPQSGDVVIVTGEAVLQAMLEGRLGWSEAERRGLIVLDGPPAAMARVTSALSAHFNVAEALARN